MIKSMMMWVGARETYGGEEKSMQSFYG